MKLNYVAFRAKAIGHVQDVYVLQNIVDHKSSRLSSGLGSRIVDQLSIQVMQ